MKIQLNALKQLPPILPRTAMLDLPDEQYRVLNTIVTSLGSISGLISSSLDLQVLGSHT